LKVCERKKKEVFEEFSEDVIVEEKTKIRTYVQKLRIPYQIFGKRTNVYC